ncbi:unnamed protein product [Caenorhabditis angaria]|uniref:Nematode cuticle collagen N-terminal domain-containing protein n=1 Tax=Caenorhabditis angaria TaxID=860376 RepID=A0A9P1N7Q5_9PELO|nr:unnamed protein product [Caenorhabditis angaria]
MSSSIISIILIAIIVKPLEANEEIVYALKNLDLVGDQNSHLYNILIVVILAISVIFLLILIVSLLFKKAYDWYTAREYKTCDLEASLKEEKDRDWRRRQEDEEKQLQQVLIHAELIKMQGDYLPEMECLPEY